MGFFGGGGNPNYISGVGAPGTLLKPQGCIYTRTDAQGLYISAPTFVTPTVVQFTQGNNHSTGGGATLGSPATAGNLLIASIGWNNDQSAFINAGWTILLNDNGGNAGLPTNTILYRYAQAGDGTTPPVFWSGGANAFWGYTIVEISGVIGNAAADFILSAITGANAAFNATFNVPAHLTTTAGQLALAILAAYNGTANYAVPAGFTAVDNWNGGNYGSMLIAKQTPASGTDVGSYTVTRPVGTNSNYQGSTLILAAKPTGAWTQITIP